MVGDSVNLPAVEVDDPSSVTELEAKTVEKGMWKTKVYSFNKAFLSLALIVMGLSSPVQNVSAQSQLDRWWCMEAAGFSGTFFGPSKLAACQPVSNIWCGGSVDPMFLLFLDFPSFPNSERLCTTGENFCD